jgi:hypothetical protein
MMTILARALVWLSGTPKLLAVGAITAIMTFAHQWWQERDARIQAQGVKTCEAEQQLLGMKAQLTQAQKVAEKAIAAIEYERQVTEELRNERQAIRREFDDYKVAASSDPRCLSDGVLDLLRGGAEVRSKRGG